MVEMLEFDITNHILNLLWILGIYVYMYTYIYIYVYIHIYIYLYIYIYVYILYIYIFYFFAIIQNRSIVYDTGHFINEGNSFIIYTYIYSMYNIYIYYILYICLYYIYIYIHIYIYISGSGFLHCSTLLPMTLNLMVNEAWYTHVHWRRNAVSKTYAIFGVFEKPQLSQIQKFRNIHRTNGKRTVQPWKCQNSKK